MPTGGEHVELIDTAGTKFDYGLTPDHVGALQTELLLRVNPTYPGKQVMRTPCAAVGI